MITSINDKNRAKYEALFKKASKVLNGTEDSIQTLEQYFSNIEKLSSESKYFTILPTDEEYFEIDANSRAITIPADFRKNGLGVKGDQVAEIIYFEIDRYFDFMDLGHELTQIFIQWKNPNGETGVSVPWVKDLDTHTDKLIFGWPISDEITSGSGTLQFSVRFVRFDNPSDIENRKVVYNLSTLTASVTINPSITEINNNELLVNDIINEMIMGRIKNTTTNTNDDLEARPPIFIPDCFLPTLGEIADGDCLKLDNVVLDADNTSYTFKARAYKPDIHGELKYALSNNAKNASTIDGVDIKVVYEDAVGKTYNSQAGYFTSDGTDVPEFSDEDIENGLIKKEAKYYQPICHATVTKAGKYFFAANNYYNSLNNYTVYPKGYEIPGPGEVTISTNDKVNFVREDGFTTENVIVTKKDSKTILSYIWKKKGDDDEYTATALEPASEVTYVPETEGIYKLTVRAARNNEKVDTTIKNELHVYDKAVVPELAITTTDGNTEYTVGEIITCDISNELAMKNIAYSWYYTGAEGKTIIGTEKTCTLPSAALGKKVFCEVTNYNGFEENIAKAEVETNYVGDGR